MTTPNLRYVLSLCCGAALLTACPGDDSPPEVTTGEDSTSTTGMVTVTSPTTVTVTDTTPMTSEGSSGTTVTDPDTTVGPATDTTVGPPDTDTDTEGTTVGTTEGTTAGTTAGSESGTATGGMALPCADQDLGDMVPQAVMGSTVGAMDDFVASCAFMGGNDEDFVYQFTAPFDGDFTIDTAGSPIDTILTVLDVDCVTELACNDDEPSGMSLQSEIVISLTMGQTIAISVDGWNESGDFNLNIDGVPAGMTSGSSSSSGGMMGGFGFGDCGGGAMCGVMGEQCFGDMAMTVTICTLVGCAVDADCPNPDPALGGTADVVCQDLNGDMMAEECSLDCSMGQTCPTGMDCFAGFICVWPAP